MRILLLAPLLLAGACNVSKDDNGTTVQFDENTAQDAAAEVGNTAQDVGAAIANGAEDAAAKVDNQIDGDDNQASNATNQD